MTGYVNGYTPIPYRYEVRAFSEDGANQNGPVRYLGHMLWIEAAAGEGFSLERRNAAFSAAVDCVTARRYPVLLGHRRVTAGAGFVAEYLIEADRSVVELTAADRLNLNHEAGKDVPLGVVK